MVFPCFTELFEIELFICIKMSLHLPIDGNKYATLLSYFVPTMNSTEEVKESFYHNLHALLRRISLSDKLHVMGDFSAHVGHDTLS